MSTTTGIEWTDATWNPVTGCTSVSEGCERCYARRLHERFHGPGSFDRVQLHEAKLSVPLHWAKPRRIFVNSMSDLFHRDVPDTFIAAVFAIMARTPRHTYQVLTKRPGRMRSQLSASRFAEEVAMGALAYGTDLGDAWPLPNVWLGVSVEDQRWAEVRVPALLDTPATARFLSCEPLLGPLDLGAIDTAEGTVDALVGNGDHVRDLDGHLTAMNNPRPLPRIDWVIAGGESGPGARAMHPAWARSLRDLCTAAGVAFLFKQWGEYRPPLMAEYPPPGPVVTVHNPGDHTNPLMVRVGKKAAGRLLDGRTWDQYPTPRPDQHPQSTTREDQP